MSINHQWFLTGVAEVDDDNEDIQKQSDEKESSYESSLEPSSSGKLHFNSSHFRLSSIYVAKFPIVFFFYWLLLYILENQRASMEINNLNGQKVFEISPKIKIHILFVNLASCTVKYDKLLYS